MDSRTGIISGKLSYTSSGVATVTVTATEPGGQAASLAFLWTVADATIGTLVGTEMYGGTALSNAVTADGITTTVLYICPYNKVKLQVYPPTGGNLPLWEDILYWIDGTGASPARGNFGGAAWPVLSLSGEASNYLVKAGTDLNGDGILQASEMIHVFQVRVINFTGSTAKSQRVGGDDLVEPNLTPIKFGEQFDVGGTFKFELSGGNPGGVNSMIRYQLEDWDSFSTLREGWGTAFTYTFGVGAAEGFSRVRFYADRNGNAALDAGEWLYESELFRVLQKRVYNLVVDVSSAIPNADTFKETLKGLFAGATNLLLGKDSADDWRAAVKLNVASSRVFTATDDVGGRPDPVDSPEAQAKQFAAEADFVFVNDFTLRNILGTTGNDWHEITIDYQAHLGNGGVLLAAFMAGTIAHEFGHGVGLIHPEPDDATNNHLVMTTDPNGTYNHLTRSDAEAYRWGNPGQSSPLTLAASPVEDVAVPPLTAWQLATALPALTTVWAELQGDTTVDWSLIELVIADLPGSLLGLTAGNVIWIDQDAAGHGWFIDPTPGAHSEFHDWSSLYELQALPNSPAYGKADLLTVLLHELGHTSGFEHSNTGFMEASLGLGVRRLPENATLDQGTTLIQKSEKVAFLGLQAIAFSEWPIVDTPRWSFDETLQPFRSMSLPIRVSASVMDLVPCDLGTQGMPAADSKPALIAGELFPAVRSARQHHLLDALFARRDWWKLGEEGEPWTA